MIIIELIRHLHIEKSWIQIKFILNYYSELINYSIDLFKLLKIVLMLYKLIIYII